MIEYVQTCFVFECETSERQEPMTRRCPSVLGIINLVKESRVWRQLGMKEGMLRGLTSGNYHSIQTITHKTCYVYL